MDNRTPRLAGDGAGRVQRVGRLQRGDDVTQLVLGGMPEQFAPGGG